MKCNNGNGPCECLPILRRLVAVEMTSSTSKDKKKTKKRMNFWSMTFPDRVDVAGRWWQLLDILVAVGRWLWAESKRADEWNTRPFSSFLPTRHLLLSLHHFPPNCRHQINKKNVNIITGIIFHLSLRAGGITNSIKLNASD